MRLIKILWPYGREAALRLIHTRELAKFGFGSTGETIEGRIVHILGDQHATIEVAQKRKRRGALRAKGKRNASKSDRIAKAALSERSGRA